MALPAGALGIALRIKKWADKSGKSDAIKEFGKEAYDKAMKLLRSRKTKTKKPNQTIKQIRKAADKKRGQQMLGVAAAYPAGVTVTGVVAPELEKRKRKKREKKSEEIERIKDRMMEAAKANPKMRYQDHHGTWTSSNGVERSTLEGVEEFGIERKQGDPFRPPISPAGQQRRRKEAADGFKAGGFVNTRGEGKAIRRKKTRMF
jgi:hypothetical protein